MHNRIDLKFQELQKKGQKAFISFITAGDPDLKTTIELVLALEKSGVDIVELGIPFSDPMADGPTIQAASQRALLGGVSVKKIFDAVKEIRQHSQIPLALMTYYNPVYHFGETQFIKQCYEVGVNGLVIPDLPVEESDSLVSLAKQKNIATIFFLAPTTHNQRMSKIIHASTGFIYYVSLTGVTGERGNLPKELKANLAKIKIMTNKPICVGFGVSTQQQVKEVAAMADGVIVGSAIVKEIEKNLNNKNLVNHVAQFVAQLTKAC